MIVKRFNQAMQLTVSTPDVYAAIFYTDGLASSHIASALRSLMHRSALHLSGSVYVTACQSVSSLVSP